MDLLKLGITMGEARERHKKQDKVEAQNWQNIHHTREANRQLKVAQADATTASENLALSEARERAASTEALKARTALTEAIATAEAAAAKVETLNTEKEAYAAAAAVAEAGRRAAVSAARRIQLENSRRVPVRANESGLTTMERKIRVIESAAKALGCDVMCVPRGMKKNLMAHCLAEHRSLFTSESQFMDAWKSASAKKRVKAERHADYVKRN